MLISRLLIGLAASTRRLVQGARETGNQLLGDHMLQKSRKILKTPNRCRCCSVARGQ